MTKAKEKKPTLKQEIEKLFNAFTHDQLNNLEFENIWNLFEPHLKKKSPPTAIEIPKENLKFFNELWPEGKLSTGKYGKCSESELISSFTWFFKTHPTFTDWNIIMKAASTYTAERAADNWNYTRRSKYFVRKQMPDKSWTSDLSEYYEREINGAQENFIQENKGFEPLVS